LTGATVDSVSRDVAAILGFASDANAALVNGFLATDSLAKDWLTEDWLTEDWLTEDWLRTASSGTVVVGSCAAASRLGRAAANGVRIERLGEPMGIDSRTATTGTGTATGSLAVVGVAVRGVAGRGAVAFGAELLAEPRT